MFGIGIPEMILIVILWIVPGAVGAVVAGLKGRNIVLWFFLSAILWFPILIVAVLPPAKAIPGRYRACPGCRKIIPWNATVCKYCRSEIKRG